MDFEKAIIKKNNPYMDILKETQDEINELKVKYHFAVKERTKENTLSLSLDTLNMIGKMDAFQKIFEYNLFDIPSAIYYTKIAQDFKDIKTQITTLLTENGEGVN